MNRIINKFFRMYFQVKAGPKAPIFIHIPKTGGTFLGQFESFKTPVLWPVKHLGHVAVSGRNTSKNSNYPPIGYSKRKLVTRQSLEGRFVFSTCRNIFDWLVSYAAHAGGWNPKYNDPNHYDYKNAQKGFDYLLKTIANREEPWPSRKLIHFPMFEEEGSLVVDWICRTETLNQDLEDLASYLGCSYTSRKKQRVGGHAGYKTYYTDNLIDIVYQNWGAELALFGYDFDGIREEFRFLPRLVDKNFQDRVRYRWDSDILTIDNKVIPKNIRTLDEERKSISL